ncbi:transporter substrate-binding domain-containing protein [Marivirga atlantica]|uniref:Transporter substrate-binding domain-containing protein n=2 Tax=Marivirga atlantica TaxID=1548457 RepID=A0A937ANR2_9BACT|nr:transporter substrate-binding domain-containing protein [Marivirga atlantica]
MLCLALIAALLGCSKSNNSNSDVIYNISPPDIDLPAIKERGVLRAIVDNSATSYFIYKGRPMGYEYEMLRWLADYLEVELKIIIKNDIAEALKLLNEGEGDIVAFNLTITNERKRFVDFTEPLYYARQVLVQKRPDNWRTMKIHEIEQELIRDPIELAGKTVHVRKASAYITRLKNLSEEIGSEINIVEDTVNAEIDELIRQVAEGEIDYTVADEDVALLSATFFPDIDVKTPISFSQRIAWAIRQNSDSLENTINGWLEQKQKTTDYYVVYNKYFKNLKRSANRSYSEFSSVAGDKLSPYDEEIKVASDQLGWDWLLLASLIYQESKFDPNAQSWAGAVGLMQLVENTAEEYGISNRNDPNESLNAGTAYINWLQNTFSESIQDSVTRLKFVLAAYNVGIGHIQDARRLCKKYDADPNKWEGNVEKYLLLKSKEKYYTDPVVRYGYCRGSEPVNYVESILQRYKQYKQLVKSDEIRGFEEDNSVI